MTPEQFIKPDIEGVLFFNRRHGDGEVVEVEVKTDFTNDQLLDLISLAGENSPWNEYKDLLRIEGRRASGLGRELQTDNFAKIPRMGGLRDKENVIISLNVLFSVTSILAAEDEGSKRFLEKVFAIVEPETVIQATSLLRDDLESVLVKHDWIINIEKTNPQAMKIIKRIHYLKTVM